jgi:hypothetical protein
MILVEQEWKELITFQTKNWAFDEESFMKREDFRKKISWHIPTEELVECLKSISPSVSIGSGFAYTESLAISRGADVIPTDIEPGKDNKWCREGKFYCEVEKLSAYEAIQKYNDRNVFMGWPPYDTPMAAEVAKNMGSGKYLLYVGESAGGCNGDGEFFTILYEDFEEIESFYIPRWSGIYDEAKLYRKK